MSTGINATMIAGGEITGKVINAVTHVGVVGAGACAEAEGHQEGCAVTNANGEYEISGLPSGSYSIWFHANSGNGRPGPGWSEYYDGKPSSAEASLVPVTAGSVTGGIDAETPDGQLAGRVTSAAGGSAIEGVEVCARLIRGGLLAPFLGCALTGSTGEYTILGLLSGPYEVQFVTAPAIGNYLTQYYDAKSSSSTADHVSVTSGSVIGGIDAEMQVGGEVTGEVTSASTHGALANMSVCAEGSMGLPERCVHTNAAEYAVTGLPSGSFRMKFSRPREAGNYLSQLYAGHTTFASANLVSVTAGGVTGAINAEMLSGGEITGRVSSAAGGAGIAGITVCAENTTGFSESFDEEFGGGETECAVTNSTGGSASAASNALTVTAPKSGFSLIKAPTLDAKRAELDFYFKIASAGKLKWSLFFKKGKKCKVGFVKHKGKCVHSTVLFGRGAKSVPAGTVEIKVHVRATALKALKAGHRLHVSGPFTLQSAQGGAPISHIESAVVHWPKKEQHGKK